MNSLDEVEVILLNGMKIAYREVRYPNDPTARWISKERAIHLVGRARLQELERRVERSA